jgi:hypothetical protein
MSVSAAPERHFEPPVALTETSGNCNQTQDLVQNSFWVCVRRGLAVNALRTYVWFKFEASDPSKTFPSLQAFNESGDLRHADGASFPSAFGNTLGQIRTIQGPNHTAKWMQVGITKTQGDLSQLVW